MNSWTGHSWHAAAGNRLVAGCAVWRARRNGDVTISAGTSANTLATGPAWVMGA
jgi:hypothetical protein